MDVIYLLVSSLWSVLHDISICLNVFCNCNCTLYDITLHLVNKTALIIYFNHYFYRHSPLSLRIFSFVCSHIYWNHSSQWAINSPHGVRGLVLFNALDNTLCPVCSCNHVDIQKCLTLIQISCNILCTHVCIWIKYSLHQK